MGVQVLEFALKADPQRALALLQPLLQAAGDAGAGPQRHGQEHADQPAGAAAQAQVGEISQALNSGRHTTTSTQLVLAGRRARSGALIDSPGFQEFGLRHIDADAAGRR